MDWQKIEYAKGGITRSIYDKNGTWARREDVEKLIDDRKDLVRKYKDQIGRTARAIIERDELRAQLEAVREWLDGFDKGRLAGTWEGTALMDLDNILQPDSGKGLKDVKD